MTDTSPEALLAWCEDSAKFSRGTCNGAVAERWEALAALVRAHQTRPTEVTDEVVEAIGRLTARAEEAEAALARYQKRPKCKACNGMGGGETRMGSGEWTCDVCKGTGLAPFEHQTRPSRAQVEALISPVVTWTADMRRGYKEAITDVLALYPTAAPIGCAAHEPVYDSTCRECRKRKADAPIARVEEKK